MEYQFDLFWRSQPLDEGRLQDLTDSLTADSVVLINSGGSDTLVTKRQLFRPRIRVAM